MNSKAVCFDLDESGKNNIGDEQAMTLGMTDVLYEDELMLLGGICKQLYYSTVDIYGL
jgi:hypothetical protein